MAKTSSIELEHDGFVCEGRRYRYEDVVSISYYYLVTSTSMNLMPIYKDHKITVTVHFRSGDAPIVIHPQYNVPSLYFPGARNRIKEKIDAARDIAGALLQATFPYRAASYVNMMEANGYFVYDNKRFFKNGTIEFGTHVFHMRQDGSLYKRPFEVFSKREGFFHNVADKLAGSQLRISTTSDPDVFFFLMERYFDLRWA